MSEFYYGLPQSIWDNLCCNAEDLLYEEGLGQHIVGIYPAGNRIFGEESHPPGLLCLYMDSVDSLIDPFNNYENSKTVHQFSVGNSLSPIMFVDIFKWIQWHYRMCATNSNSTYSPLRDGFLHMIPFGRHTVYEDPSISPIIDAVAEFSIKESYYPKPWNGYKPIVFGPALPIKEEIIFNRTEAIIASKKVFMPCVNRDWDEKLILDNEKDFECHNEKFYNDFYWQLIQSNQRITPIDSKKINEVRKMVLDLYRFQL